MSLALEKDVSNECILSVCGRILLIDMKLAELDQIKEQLDIIAVLCNGKLLHLGDLGIHINFEVGLNACKNQGKNCQTIYFFFASILADPGV
jgi:hypothetical protein